MHTCRPPYAHACGGVYAALLRIKDRMYIWDFFCIKRRLFLFVFVCFSVKTSSSLSRPHTYTYVCVFIGGSAATTLAFWNLKGAAPFAQFFPQNGGDLTSAPDPLPTVRHIMHFTQRTLAMHLDALLKLHKLLIARILQGVSLLLNEKLNYEAIHFWFLTTRCDGALF